MDTGDWDRITERRRSSQAERDNWTEGRRHINGNGSGRVPLTWAQLGTLVVAILSAAGYGGFKAAAPISPSSMASDHDQITSLGKDVEYLKRSLDVISGRLDRIDTRGEESQALLRRLAYKGGSFDQPAPSRGIQ